MALNWEGLCNLLSTRFGRDRHQLLIRQFFAIKQSSTVQDYIERFEHLMNQLLSYFDEIHPFYFLTRFIGGLRADLRAAIMVQRPADLDTACALALVQEEVQDGVRPENIRFPEQAYRPAPRLPLQAVPLHQPRPPTTPAAVDRCGVEAARAAPVEQPRPQPAEANPLNTLRAYRRARGLCFKCGERWGRDHTCPATIQMHVLEELMDFLGVTPSEEAEPSNTSDTTEETVHAVSLQAFNGNDSSKLLQFSATIQGQSVEVLVDSGSSASFINSRCVGGLQGLQPMAKPARVKVANGAELQCDQELLNCQWTVQNHQLLASLKVLPLGGFDVIVGMDWLEAFNPAIDWINKTVTLQSETGPIQLQGHKFSASNCPQISSEELHFMCVQGEVDHLVYVCSKDAKPVQKGAESPDPPVEIQHLLDEFSDVFAAPQGLPPNRACDHRIPLLPGAQPISIRPYRHSPETKTEIERQVEELLASGIIQHSNSPFASPAILVRKKDGQWRLCIDYRKLNALTVTPKFPLPVIDELLDELSGASWFSKLDLRAGYHQIRLAAGEEYKTAFQTHSGHYEYKVLPFGVSGGPATFQGGMNHTLKPVSRRCALVFFDDILVFSISFEDHIKHLREVLQLLRQDQWQVKFSKCSFAQRELSYLGFVVSQQGVSTEPEKIQKVQQWPVPLNVKQLRQFLGLSGYYRKFVRHYGVIAKPLTHLLKKHVPSVWTSECTTSFETLKNALVTAPVLALPNFTKEFVVETDASDLGVGAVLQQEGHPLAFLSKPLGPKNRGLSTYEKELLAILLAVEHWRSYLQSAEFIIKTDQHSLVHLEDQRLHTPWQHKAFTKLLGLRYKICYRKGADNGAANALSRRPFSDTDELYAISLCKPEWIKDVREGYAQDTATQKIVEDLQANPQSHKKFTLSEGILRYQGRIWIGRNSQLQQQLLIAGHQSAVGGHSGAPATYQRLKTVCAWPRMKHAVTEFVQSCAVCQQAKPERCKYPGLLEPLPVPVRAWQMVSMDFIEGLPWSGRFNCILVVVDKFSKYSHFLPLSHPFSASQVATTYVDQVYRLHGLPDSILSDRDPIFTSRFWQELFRQTQTTLRMSTPYHPATDGQTERTNQCLETFLRCFVHSCPKKWSSWLPLAEFWFNTSWHSALGKSPFFVLYGHEPRHWGIEAASATPVSDLNTWLSEREEMQALIRQHLLRAQTRMKHQADKNRSERSFEIGDSVYIKLQPYVQSSVARRACHKLSFHYFGPFLVQARIGQVAYRVGLPETSKIHPVFHVSQLRKAVKPGVSVSSVLPHNTNQFAVPLEVLDSRQKTKANRVVEQVLVRWSGDTLEPTWEDRDELQSRFPCAVAWGQAATQAGEGVSRLASTTPSSQPPVEADEGTAQGPARRARKPNKRVAGEEWVNTTQEA